MPDFEDTDVGMVQARWGFLNAGFSWLTRLQSLLLSSHFGIEHAVRYKRGLFFNFNGTAGVWRRFAIESSGGWQPDTVTEDLDLSYRAQLAGWRFVYLNNVVVPSELPITLADFRCQQERWSKGSVQTAKKILPEIYMSSLPVRIKIEATAHLLANFCWLFGFIATLTLYPVLLSRIKIGPWQMIWFDVPLFLMSGVAVLAYYYVYNFSLNKKSSLYVLLLLPAVSIGLAPRFAFSVIKGLFVKGGGIYADAEIRDTVSNLVLNIPLVIYSLMPLIFAWERGTWLAIPLLCLFPTGFFIVLGNDFSEFMAYSIKQLRGRKS